MFGAASCSWSTMSEAVPCELIVVTDVVHPQHTIIMPITAPMIAKIETQENILPIVDDFASSVIKTSVYCYFWTTFVVKIDLNSCVGLCWELLMNSC